MTPRYFLIIVLLGSPWSAAHAQTPSGKSGVTKPVWRPPGQAAAEREPIQDRAVVPAAAAEASAPTVAVRRATIAKVTKGDGKLPNDHGQVWREYDISPYTTRVTSTNQPEQAIVDWVLRETGYEAWHGEAVAMLSAGKRKLRVYHEPGVQATVADIVDRFVSSEAETQAFGLRTVTIGNPNWRASAMRLLTPVPVQSQGVQGWLLAKEDAALLMAELEKRSDYRQHSSPHLLVNNGQSIVLSSIRNRTYVRDVALKAGAWPGYEPELGQIDEGYTLEFSPLLSLDGHTVDAVIKLHLNQVEKMVPVMLEVPTAVAPRQRTRVEIPQVTSCDLHERFRWPVDKVLLLSMGVVATPAPGKSNPLTAALPLPKLPERADALLFVECKGKLTVDPAVPNTARSGGNYPGRY